MGGSLAMMLLARWRNRRLAAVLTELADGALEAL
jgi:hypothetical protein